jgi:hypothetical protein
VASSGRPFLSMMQLQTQFPAHVVISDPRMIDLASVPVFFLEIILAKDSPLADELVLLPTVSFKSAGDEFLTFTPLNGWCLDATPDDRPSFRCCVIFGTILVVDVPLADELFLRDNFFLFE